MADTPESVLRNSLDAVDRGRRWAVTGVVALFLATAISVAALFGTAASASRDTADTGLLKVIFVATATELLFIACCTVVIMFHVSRTMKALLRALELFGR